MEESLQKILKKLEKIEQRVGALEQRQPPVGAIAQAQKETTKAGEGLFDYENQRLMNTRPVTAPPAASTPPVQAKRTISEAQIGKEWFNKIGAVSIIIGVVLFIGYTFQYLGPLGKIMIGYLGGLALIGLGLFFSKKYKNYANGLLAVGWAILYFTTFATYYIPASRVIFDANLNLLLLFTVSAGLALFSYFYHSEEFSIMAIFLGAFSAIISDVPFISLVAIVALISYAVMVAAAKNWARLSYVAVIISYATYYVATQRQGLFDTAGLFELGSFFLIVYFLLFAAASFFLTSGAYEERRYLTSLISINAVGFFVLFIDQIYQFHPQADGYFTALFGTMLLLIAGLAYWLAKEKKHLYTTYGWLGWGFVTLAIPLQLVGAWIAGAWLVEGAALFIIGLVRNRKSFVYTGTVTLALFLMRFLAFDLPTEKTVAVLGTLVKTRIIFSLFTIFIFSMIGLVWDYLKERILPEFNRAIISPAIVATGLLMIILALDANRDLLSIFFLLLGAIVYLVGLATNRQYLRTVSLLPLIGFGLMWLNHDLINAQTINQSTSLNYRTFTSLISSAVLFILYAAASLHSSGLTKQEKNGRDAFAIVAAAILVILALLDANRKIITVIWSFEGTLIVLAGFLFKKQVLRLTGMVILLLAILRIFIIDLSFLETIYRIVSFIVLGIILMGISFVYTKYKDKILS